MFILENDSLNIDLANKATLGESIRLVLNAESQRHLIHLKVTASLGIGK